MRILLTIIALMLLIFNTYAQKIEINEVDRFTKKQIIETSFEKIVSDKSMLGSTGGRLMKNIWIAFRKVDENEYLRLKWCTNEVIALNENADVIFLDSDGNTYTFINTEFTVSGEGEGTVGAWGSALWGLNLYLIGDCATLEDKTITAMRIYTSEGYMDFEIDKKSVNMVSKIYKVFKSAQN